MIKNSDIVNHHTLKLMQEIADAKLPAIAAFKMHNNIQKMQAVLDTFNKVQQETLKRYTKMDGEKPMHPVGEDGKPNEAQVVLTDPDAYNAEIVALLELDVTSAASIMTIKISELGNYEIEPARLALVAWMFSL